MTALCGGGPSQPIPGKQTQFYLTGGALALLASALKLPWLAEALGFIGGISFSLPDICSTDPPPDPGLTAVDIACLFQPFNPLCDAGASILKITQLINHLAWFQWCQCTNVATPAAPAAPGPPTGLIQPNPPSIVGTGGNVVCSDTAAQGLTFGTPTNVTKNDASPLPGLDTFPASTNFPVRLLPTPAPIQIQYIVSPGPAGGNPDNYNVALYYYHTDFNTISFLDSVTALGPGGFYTSPVLTIPPTTIGFGFGYNSFNLSNATNKFNIEVKFICPGNGAGGVNTLQCCPPPADLFTAIGDIKQLVTLIQRQAVPFAYIPGTLHPNLTGNGAITVQGLLGIKLTPGTLPTPLGQTAGDPTELWGAGWYSWGNADGFSRREFLTHAPQISLPAVAGQYTQIGFSFPPGLAVTITELVREP